LALSFEFVIDGPPVSQQARRREKVHQWREEVRKVAAQHWPAGELPVAESRIMLSMTYFYDTVSIDVDNIPKPISDALKGLTFWRR
jgi:Holliday junction resolvase RusA-like endonuclease